MEPQQSYQPNMPAQQTPMQIPRKRRGAAWLMLLIGLIIGGGIGGLAWFYLPRISTSHTTAQTGTTSTTSSAPSNTNTGSTAANSPSTAPATPVSCTYKDLTLTVGGTDGTAGTIYQHMVFTNSGKQTCTIAGYPAAFMLDSAHNILGSGAVPLTTYTPAVISLVPGATAHTAVGFPQAANFPAGTCTANGESIRIYLPGSTSYLDATLAKPYCPGFSATAVVAGE